jgi:DNA-binding protein HU-beta
MAKLHLTNAVRDEVKLTNDQSRRAVDAVLDAISDGLARDGAFTIPGWGSYRRVERKARTGRNPRTGEAIKIPAGHTIRFRAGPDLKAATRKARKARGRK